MAQQARELIATDDSVIPVQFEHSNPMPHSINKLPIQRSSALTLPLNPSAGTLYHCLRNVDLSQGADGAHAVRMTSATTQGPGRGISKRGLLSILNEALALIEDEDFATEK